MKAKPLVLVVLVSVLILIASCNKSTGPSSSAPEPFPTLPDALDWSWPEVGISTLMEINHWDDETYVWIEYYNEEPPSTCKLILNDNIELDVDASDWGFEVLHGHGLYYVLFSSSDIPLLGGFKTGQYISFSLKINNITNTGAIRIPYTPNVNFPGYEELTTGAGYSFTWTLPQNPDMYLVTFNMKYWADPFEYIIKRWQLSGDKRQFTIPRIAYWENLNNLIRIHLYLSTINYSRKGSFLALTGNYVYTTIENNLVASSDRITHRKRLLRSCSEMVD